MILDKLSNKEPLLGATFLPKLKNVATKLNEVIDFLKGNGKAGSGSYKVYEAILTQSGTAAPVATVLNNTIGNIVWSRSSQGSYIGTLTGAFPLGKTVIKGPQHAEITDATACDLYSSGSDDVNTVYVLTKNMNILTTTVSTVDSILYGAGYTSIEIRVYN